MFWWFVLGVVVDRHASPDNDDHLTLCGVVSVDVFHLVCCHFVLKSLCSSDWTFPRVFGVFLVDFVATVCGAKFESAIGPGLCVQCIASCLWALSIQGGLTFGMMW